jgi:hypothetical protein
MLLHFPQAPTADSQFGNAIHETLEWLQHKTDELGSVPTIQEVTKHFATRIHACKLTPDRLEIEQDRGEKSPGGILGPSQPDI